MKRFRIPIAALIIVLAAVALIANKNNPLSSTFTSSSSKHTKNSKAPEFNKNLYPTDVSNSLWAVVNKGRILPSTYIPVNLVVPNIPLRLSAASQEMHLRQDAATALEQMTAAAKTQGINLMLASGYRSYNFQVALYNSYVKNDGQAAADASSARAGHSEHQTGLAADLEPVSRKCEVDTCFESTPEGQWIAANSYKFGFIVRYQKNNQTLTGYEYEPWHVRYVGKDLAGQIISGNQTLEQFFGLATYSDYPAKMVQLK